ncbi:MAG TPA: metal ABC transporter permease [Planctomycetaceae bacterium]|nr:metal ABC transporter permease [Planctomycetaceae bacterium]
MNGFAPLPVFAAIDWADAGWTVLIASLANVSCALLGCHLVLRRMSLLGDTISHAVLPGIVVAALLTGRIAGLPILAGAAVIGLMTVVLLRLLQGKGQVPEDAGMGVLFTSFFSLGVILLTQFAGNVDLDTECVLYGEILSVPQDVVLIGGQEIPRALLSLGPVFVLTVGFVTLFWKELKLLAFDPALTEALGFSPTMLHYVFMGMVSVVVVASFEAVGSILVIAMLIVPAATAQLLTDRLKLMLGWAAAGGVLAAVLGYAGALYWNTSAAGMMAVAAGVQFVLALVFGPYGMLARGVRGLRFRLRILREDVLAAVYRAEEVQGPNTGLSLAECAEIVHGGRLFWLTMPWLLRKNSFEMRQGRLTLTDQGRRRAQSLVRSHRLWEAYLQQHFEMPLDHLHYAASRAEHYIGPRLQEELAAELATPPRDPHGREIPPAQ